MLRRLFPLVVLVGCGGGSLSESSPAITTVEPGFGPVAGGVNITITGEGFLADGAPPNRVLIGDVEAPLAAAVDDTTLVVTLPPGEAGAVPVTVFNRNGQATAEGMFRYSTAPTITGVSPADVIYDASSTTVTVTGSGFQAEDAGPATVLVDGKPAIDVTVVSDTELTFTALPGTVLDTPTITLGNRRGEAVKERGFRYILSTNPTLMVFTRFDVNRYMYLFEPLANVTLPVPNKLAPQQPVGYRALSREASGKLLASSRDGKFGELDLTTQSIASPKTLQLKFEDVERVNNVLFAVTARNQTNGARFGRLNPETLEFTEIVALPLNSPSQDLAYNGTTLYYYNSSPPALYTINPTTGARGPAIALNPARNLFNMKFVGTTLWAVTHNNELVQIDPANGALTVVQTFQSPLSNLEVFQ